MMLVDCCLYMYRHNSLRTGEKKVRKSFFFWHDVVMPIHVWWLVLVSYAFFEILYVCRPSGSDEIWNSNDRVDIFPTIDFEINLDHKMDNPIFFKIVYLTLVIFDLCYLGFLSNKPQSERSSSMIDIYNGFIQTIWQKVFYNSAYDMTMYWKIKSTILSKMSSYFWRK